MALILKHATFKPLSSLSKCELFYILFVDSYLTDVPSIHFFFMPVGFFIFHSKSVRLQEAMTVHLS